MTGQEGLGQGKSIQQNKLLTNQQKLEENFSIGGMNGRPTVTILEVYIPNNSCLTRSHGEQTSSHFLRLAAC
jgi:hypothetical protein